VRLSVIHQPLLEHALLVQVPAISYLIMLANGIHSQPGFSCVVVSHRSILIPSSFASVLPPAGPQSPTELATALTARPSGAAAHHSSSSLYLPICVCPFAACAVILHYSLLFILALLQVGREVADLFQDVFSHKTDPGTSGRARHAKGSLQTTTVKTIDCSTRRCHCHQ
jgi:hypothetical protein